MTIVHRSLGWLVAAPALALAVAGEGADSIGAGATR